MEGIPMSKTKKPVSPYELVFYSSATQDPESFTFGPKSTLADVQRFLFKRNHAPGNDAEIVVRDPETRHVIGGYMYRMGPNGRWYVLRGIEVIPA
jgi:hypothetical protein